VLRAEGWTETAQENMEDRLTLHEGDSGFQLLTGEEISPVISLFFSHKHYLYYYIFLLMVFYVSVF
jgi:hypothetical protein